MKAIGFTRNLPVMDSECLLDLEIPTPEPGVRDLLVRIEAISVNPIDTKLRRSKPAKNGAPVILGYDAAGTVEAVGSEVSRFQVGDPVYYASTPARPGSNAEFQLVDERIVGHKPSSLTWEEAASIPLTVLTAWESLFDQLGIDPEGKNSGQSLLLIGAGGGVGSMAIQLAKIAGLQTIATASTSESAAWCKKLGAAFTVNYHNPLPQELKQIGFDTVDFLFNAADTDSYWEAMAEIIAPFGGICCLVDAKQPVNLNLLKPKSARFAWELVFVRATATPKKMEARGATLGQISKLLEAGQLQTTVQRTLSPICAKSLREAHAQLETGKTQGKLVLTRW